MTKSGTIAVCCFLIAGILYGSWGPLHEWYENRDLRTDGLTCDGGKATTYWLIHHTFEGYDPDKYVPDYQEPQVRKSRF